MEYFKFEEEFSQCMEMFTIPYEKEGSGIRGIISFDPPVLESEHIIEKEGIGKVVNTNGGVLLGTMSFQMTADEFNIGWFKLEEYTGTPKTGIKINTDGIRNYQAQSTFRFTDKTASKEARLNNLIASKGEKNEEDPENSTYKEYTLSPVFEKDHLDYELTLLENIDTIDLKATLEDAKASMKIKVPKKDEDGTTIIYEEKELPNDTPLEIILNKLGEEDTKVTITVTAEDGKTTNEYALTIKRPYGTIKGNIITSNTSDIHLANIKLYNSSEQIDWENMIGHEELDQIELLAQGKTTEAGDYEIKVIPGTYDLLIDKPGYLDHIILKIQITVDKDVVIEEKELVPGDVNKDGVVEIEDMGYINDNYDAMIDDGSGIYEERFDFTGDGIVDVEDLSLINDNYDQLRRIEEYKESSQILTKSN